MYIDLSHRVKSWEILEDVLTNYQDMHHVYRRLSDYSAIIPAPYYNVPHYDIELYMIDVKNRVFIVHRGAIKPICKALGWYCSTYYYRKSLSYDEEKNLGRVQRDCLRIVKTVLAATEIT